MRRPDAGRPRGHGSGRARRIPTIRLAFVVTAACVVLGATGCSSDGPTPIRALATAPAPCPEHGIDGDVTCYRVTVPENPEHPDGRTIDLEVMVLEARSEETLADPVLVIPGGPGQSATRAAGARSYFATVFDPLRTDRDIVLIAPRGTAGSGELALDPAPERLFDDLSTVIPASWAEEARGRLEGEADLRMYTTSHIVEDIEAIRLALGYGPLNIYGTSYGTRVAQVYAGRYADRVRTMILKAPVPPSATVPLTYTSGSQRALDALFDLCRRQEPCEEAYPDLEERFEALMDRLERDPEPLTVTNPLSGEDTEVRVDDTAFGYVLRNLMMAASGGAATLSVIDGASEGDLSLLATLIPTLREAYATQLAGGMLLSVIASEDAPRVNDELLDRDAEAGFLRGAVARGMLAATAGWPRADVPPDVHEPLEEDVPTLLVTGAFDPATPPSFAAEIADRLPNAEVVVFPGGAHSANNFIGLDGIMEAFVRSGRLGGLDLSAASENRPLPLVRN